MGTESEPVPLAERIRGPLNSTKSTKDHEPPEEELEKIRKWQEERIERKLRGEYESALLHLDGLIKENLDTPMRLASVRVQGANQTRPSFLHWLLKPHLSTADTETAIFSDVLKTTSSVTRKMLETDIFASVVPKIETYNDPSARPGDLALVLQTRQKGRFFLKTATEVGDQDGSVTLQMRLRNALGGAETLEASLSSGLRTRLAGHVSLGAPITPDLKTRGELSVFGLEKDWTALSSCVEGVRGVRASIRNAGKNTNHEIAYEASLRHIHALTEGASLSVRNEAGHSIKSGIHHSWTFDTRDEKAVPSRGSYIKSQSELAGLGGDASFLKSSLSCQLAHTIFPGLTASLSLRSGILYPFSPFTPISSSPSTPSPSSESTSHAQHKPKTHISDRFQLGGPLDVRMFKHNGLGPRDGDDALGGDLFWAAGASLVSNLPGKRMREWPVKAHAFVNAGRLDALRKDIPLAEAIHSCVSRPCISAGVGILYRLDPVRVELNFGVPLVASRSDAHRRGFQVGIGLDFL